MLLTLHSWTPAFHHVLTGMDAKATKRDPDGMGEVAVICCLPIAAFSILLVHSFFSRYPASFITRKQILDRRQLGEKRISPS